ncbi:MAG: glycosyltransferase family 1 protein [Patescibacteria group bacterium]|nr:glycosyltransferase family 1 protein [Patescibacteria group bacterium]
MIIGIDASRANKKEKTGTEWYSYNLIQQFSKLDQKNKYRLYTKKPWQENINNLGNNFENKVLKWPFGFLWNLIRLSWEMIINPPDVLFVPAHTIPLFSRTKIITTCHDVGFEVFPEFYAKKLIGGKNLFSKILYLIIKIFSLGRYSNNELDYHRFSMKLAVKKAYSIITPSKFTAHEIKKYYNINRSKVNIIYEGYDQDQYHPTKNNKLKKKILDKYNIKEPFLIYVGRLEKKKNILGLLKTFSLIKKKYKKPLKLLLVGKPGYGWKKAEQFLNTSNIQREVIRPGWVSDKDLPLLYNTALALVFISYYEGFGLPPLEAMSCGCPVIVSDRASMPEIVGSGGLILDPDNYKQIAKEIIKIIKNNKNRQNLIKKGFSRIEKFSWQKCARQTLELIKNY